MAWHWRCRGCSGWTAFCGAAFVFRAKRADRINLLLWDQTGMVFAIGLERMATR